MIYVKYTVWRCISNNHLMAEEGTYGASGELFDEGSGIYGTSGVWWGYLWGIFSSGVSIGKVDG